MEEDWSEGSIYSGDPARDELVKGAMGRIGRGKPVVIINLLRFREVSIDRTPARALEQTDFPSRTPTTKA